MTLLSILLDMTGFFNFVFTLSIKMLGSSSHHSWTQRSVSKYLASPLFLGFWKHIFILPSALHLQEIKSERLCVVKNKVCMPLIDILPQILNQKQVIFPSLSYKHTFEAIDWDCNDSGKDKSQFVCLWDLLATFLNTRTCNCESSCIPRSPCFQLSKQYVSGLCHRCQW